MLIPIIGLEIHIQPKTKTKMFCACAVHDETAAPNTHVCPICLGHPGVLPVPNGEAVRKAITIGLALGCRVNHHSKFDRKNYFYPDLPKAYQISQFDLPVVEKGSVEVEVPGEDPVTIGITRAHLEEDAAKNTHDKSGNTFVDFNRGGTPLIEIVTEPDFRRASHAKAFLQELRRLARFLDVSDADMEKGHMRCDANISLRQIDENGAIIGETFNPKTEIKNLNSFKHVERAIEYEIRRQTRLWQEGTPPMVSTTRGWNEGRARTEQQRTKEAADDYRYFPEPDIPPLALADLEETLRAVLPEFPKVKRQRFVEEYGLKQAIAAQICDDPAWANFAEATFSEVLAWLNGQPEFDDLEESVQLQERARAIKLAANWMLTKLTGLLAARGSDLRIMKVTPENFAELIGLLLSKQISTTAAATVLEQMLETGDDPSHLMEEAQLGRMDDEEALGAVIDRVIAAWPEEVARYQAGETKLLQFFIGMIMKETEGTADAGMTRNMLSVKLK